VVKEKLIDEISARLKDVMARTPAADIERNLRATLSAMFARLDLVTREEFDVQSVVLARTREKLAALEARLAELEKTAGSSVSK
jgi:ubiquinone biosynthesis accessory factor UbiK